MQDTALANNVVRLPTAARKRVQQPGVLLQRQLVDAQGIARHPAERINPEARKPWDEASFTRSAEMIVATAIFKVLSDADKARVRRAIDTIALLSPHGEAAAHIVEKLK
ncbi:hypothetical protein SAMN06295912_13522 [Sphingomonas laterariae]|uniref:Uncharacterized protein n=1 Tax=Edaphosphingomonas laterariae TaxID=861865 RepID=A0A239JJB8_9SPHN|nr:hypothetical protein [Sphingomonas laterariae]SNT05682.1 hypothetical protein SAMN06295912_13522 [Sphingomonas laterariae]